MDSKENILIKAYDFVKVLIPIVNSFPRNQRYILGNHMEKMALEAMELLIEAYYLPHNVKKPKLHQINLLLEKLRYLSRLCYELGYYNSSKYSFITEKLIEIGRMTGGWLKSLG